MNRFLLKIGLMRQRFEVQLALGAVPIERVEIPTRTRDERPPTLAALQWVFATPEVSREVFELLENRLLRNDLSKGRPGMDLWQILVLGVVRLTLDLNYDRLHHVANYDSLVRQLLGQPAFDTTLQFKLSTLKENVALLSEELLEKINVVIARHSGQVIKKKDAGLSIKVDSYAFESTVHFPTDLNLGWDCARKCIELCTRLCQTYDLTGWRKHANWRSRIKALARRSARASSSGGKNKATRVEIIMPKKGKLAAADQDRQSQKRWRQLANKHSGIESDINSLEHHGLDRCPDKGYAAYARYAGLGILAYNLHRIGNHLLKEQKRIESLAQAA